MVRCEFSELLHDRTSEDSKPKTEKDIKFIKMNSNYFQFHIRIIWTAQNLQGRQG